MPLNEMLDTPWRLQQVNAPLLARVVPLAFSPTAMTASHPLGLPRQEAAKQNPRSVLTALEP